MIYKSYIFAAILFVLAKTSRNEPLKPSFVTNLLSACWTGSFENTNEGPLKLKAVVPARKPN